MSSSSGSMISLLLLSFLLLHAQGALQQIGAIPIKGNTWRAKYANEIVINHSLSFYQYIESQCITTTSTDTGITYYLSPIGLKYPHFEKEETLCEFGLGKRNPYDDRIQNLTVYFGCDDTCCYLECCQKDWPISILGISFIILAVIILIIYILITSTSIIIRLQKRNGWCTSLSNRTRITKDGTALTLITSHNTAHNL